ncbi:MAG: hypothetical protein ACK41C_18195 [Phenylobacterium sp.]|uniref:hypothetical protein n=1 Tax=Phenylobacterium sp. TaxID=1871053 RepID=UPI00391C6461
MGRFAGASTTGRRLWLALATLALALKIAVPAGFMAAPTNDLPFAIVLCTAQGATVIEPGAPLPHEGGAPSAPEKHDPPCAFAGHGLNAPPAEADFAGRAEFAAYAPPPIRALTHLAPGRGLAAPPLPARGPPSLPI